MRAKFAPALMVAASLAVAGIVPAALAQTTSETKSTKSTGTGTTSSTTKSSGGTSSTAPHAATTAAHPETATHPTSTTEHAAAQSSGGGAKIGPHDFQTKKWYIGPRLGFGNLEGGTAIGGQVERGFTEPGAAGPGIITGGVAVDWYSWSYDYQPFGSYDYTVTPIQVFSNYHYILKNSPKIDPFGGLALVYSVISSSWTGNGIAIGNVSESTFDIAGQVGMQYFFTPKFCGRAQLGFGYTTFGVGVSFRL
ncbi:MAG: hypothetical protein ACRENN_00445 [Candidatus Eiseniibacteriota bacterium]